MCRKAAVRAAPPIILPFLRRIVRPPHSSCCVWHSGPRAPLPAAGARRWRAQSLITSRRCTACLASAPSMRLAAAPQLLLRHCRTRPSALNRREPRVECGSVIKTPTKERAPVAAFCPELKCRQHRPPRCCRPWEKSPHRRCLNCARLLALRCPSPCMSHAGWQRARMLHTQLLPPRLISVSCPPARVKSLPSLQTACPAPNTEELASRIAHLRLPCAPEPMSHPSRRARRPSP